MIKYKCPMQLYYIYSLHSILDDVLESLTKTNTEIKRPKRSSRSRDRDVLGKEKGKLEKQKGALGNEKVKYF
jgi:hypothetical protein